MKKNATVAWRDISLSQGQKLKPTRVPLLLGGSVSVWTGDYARRGCLLPFTLDGVQHRWLFYGQRCSGAALMVIQRSDQVCNVPCPVGPCQCGNTTKYLPKASWMSANTSAADAAFSQSVSRWTWPVASAAAGSFWNWQPHLPQQVIAQRLRALTTYMASRGVATCPFDVSGCPGGCTYTAHCGVPYPTRRADGDNITAHDVVAPAAAAPQAGAASSTLTTAVELQFPLPPEVIGTSPPGTNHGHCWFPQFFTNFSGKLGSKIYGSTHAQDDGCPAPRAGCNRTSAGQCHQPCMAGQAFSSPAPQPGTQPQWTPLSVWGGEPNPMVPGTPCGRPNLTANGEVVCMGWRWKRASSCAPTVDTQEAGDNCSTYVSNNAVHYKFDAHGTITWWQGEMEMQTTDWPLSLPDGAIQTGSSNVLTLPGGALFQTVYFPTANSFLSATFDPKQERYYGLAGILSTDGAAKVFRFMSMIDVGDATKPELSESSSVLTQSGRVRVVYRVRSKGPSGWQNYYTVRSSGSDVSGLRMWSTPKPLSTTPIASARPVLQSLRLSDGSLRLILSGGRPSLHLYLSMDGEGEQWGEGINIATVHNSHFGNHSNLSFCQPLLAGSQGCPCPERPTLRCQLSGTTGYTSLVPLATSKADPAPRFLLTYDKLGNGWYGPRNDGPRNSSLDIDAVFSLVVRASFAAKTDDVAVTLSPTSLSAATWLVTSE
jgi:hypothetical protein